MKSLDATVKNLREEILVELNDNFKLQSKTLRKILECVDGTAINETPKENFSVTDEETTEQNPDKPTPFE